MSEDKLVAKVNGKEITRADVMKFLNDMGPQMAMQFQSPEGIQRVVDEMVNQELLYLDARENDLDKEEEYKNLLKTTEVTLLKNYAFNKAIASETPTEEEIKDYYNKNKNEFGNPEMAKASHILVEAEDQANEVVKELESGTSFEDAAVKYSTCPSKEQGGKLGEFGRGQMVPEFENAVFDMEVGTISEPVKSQFGYHIIYLEDMTPAQEQTFEEAREEAANHVARAKQQEKYMEKVNSLKEVYEVEYM